MSQGIKKTRSTTKLQEQKSTDMLETAAYIKQQVVEERKVLRGSRSRQKQSNHS